MGYTGIPGPVYSCSFGNVPSSFGKVLMIKLHFKVITLLVEQVVTACCPFARHHDGTASVFMWKTEFLVICILKGLKGLR